MRRALRADAAAGARLLGACNAAFGEPTPGVRARTRRLRQLDDLGDPVPLAGNGADGVAVLRLRPAIWHRGLGCHLAAL